MMKILHYSGKSAVIDLSQQELLLAMALIQEGREALQCDSDASNALDTLFTSANILVEQARRQALKRRTSEPGGNVVVAPLRSTS
tara:strand:+ start:6305 stop:6559 length:255 start_codon:yes stop_codon:yes gene_type:complete